MNLYVYFQAPSIELVRLPSHLKEKARPILYGIRQTNAPIDWQQKEIQMLSSALYGEQNQDEPNEEKILQEAKSHLEANRQPVWKNWMDFFLFVPCWIVIVQMLLGTGREQGIFADGFSSTLEWGAGDLLGAAAVYLIVKSMLGLLGRYPAGWRRWLTLMGGYGLLLLATWLCKDLPGRLSMPTSALAIVCACVFLAAWKAHVTAFGPKKSEPRVS